MSMHSHLLLLLLLLAALVAVSGASTETLIGLRCRDFIVLAADSSLSQSIAVTSSSIDKIFPIAPVPFIPRSSYYSKQSQSQQKQKQNQSSNSCHLPVAFATAGNCADCDALLSDLSERASLHAFTHSSLLDVRELAFLARKRIAESLRTKRPLQVCLLAAGLSSTRVEDWESGVREKERLKRQALSGGGGGKGGELQQQEDGGQIATTATANAIVDSADADNERR